MTDKKGIQQKIKIDKILIFNLNLEINLQKRIKNRKTKKRLVKKYYQTKKLLKKSWTYKSSPQRMQDFICN